MASLGCEVDGPWPVLEDDGSNRAWQDRDGSILVRADGEDLAAWRSGHQAVRSLSRRLPSTGSDRARARLRQSGERARNAELRAAARAFLKKESA